MFEYLDIIQVVISVLLVVGILLQNRGSGLSSAFGGSGEFFQTKRGIEKGIFIATIVLAVIFLGLGLLRLILAR